MTSRRNFLLGLGAALAAPAIIRTTGLLMPVRVPMKITFTIDEWVAALRQANLSAFMDSVVYGFCAVEYPKHGLPRALDPMMLTNRLGQFITDNIETESGFEIIKPVYNHEPDGRGLVDVINWNPPDTNVGRKIVAADWPYLTITAPPGGFKVVA